MSRVLHLIPRLVQGGAETLLVRYLSGQTIHSHRCVTLFQDNDARMAEQLGDRLEARRCRGYADVLRDMPWVRRRLAMLSPDVVVAWMYHAGVMAPWLAPRGVPVLAYLHNTDLKPGSKRLERAAQRALGRIAKGAGRHLLYSGAESQALHEGLGYPAGRSAAIPNGIPTELFAPDAADRAAIRTELGLTPEERVFGCFGRFDPQKNWPLVLDAVACAADVAPVRLLAAGRGVSRETPEFEALIRARGLEDRVLALGVRSDMARLHRAADVLLLASGYGEAQPLVVLEALATGRPVIATDLGSVGDVLLPDLPPVPVGDAGAFIATVEAAARGDWPGLKLPEERLRARVVERFGQGAFGRALDTHLAGLAA
ncbi:glycosyltransferase [Histidinibacterium aquaticum]|uniref:Glycosyltransferase n=1 Tax=Histidinibacterium aquaticum TaxID=2613962 RepID=A0A5J5GJB4_9RHOB|nr:glycosyltransferase [Histidinibacterium aquaticum]KAA9007833.1 glycosyltransferase [Histidinibacterium aquaticum]